MISDVVLCADTESLKNPRLIGLEGENLCAQPWLRLFADACQARRYLRQNSNPHEVWVASSDSVDPINLAAALKRDSASNTVYLLAFQGSGSLKSRASAAGIDGTFDRTMFTRRYGWRKESALTRCERPEKTGKGISPVQKAADRIPAVSVLLKSEPPSRACAPSSECASSKELDSEFLRGLDLGRSPQSSSPPPKKVTRVSTSVDPEGSSTQGELSPADSSSCRSAAIKRQAFVLAVASASGGAGKSTVAALAATFAQGLGHKTLLIDADLQFGDEQFLLGVENPLTIDEVLCDSSRLARLKPQGGLPALLAAPKHLEQSESVPIGLPLIFEAAKAAFEVVVVNTGAFWTEQHALLLEQATRVLFLIDQRPSSLRACNHALELCGRCGIATQPFLFAVNRCARGSIFSSIDVSCGLRGAHVVELKEGGREVDELLGAGMPLELIRSENTLCVSLENILVDILPSSEREVSQQLSESEKTPGKYSRFSKWKRKVACLC
ncbi:MAG: chromosome partitioning protein ParA [Raoultibacter sp.]